jgi:hypothetical protein
MTPVAIAVPQLGRALQQGHNLFGGSGFRFHVADFQPHLPPEAAVKPRPNNNAKGGDDQLSKCDEKLARKADPASRCIADRHARGDLDTDSPQRLMEISNLALALAAIAWRIV